MIIVGASGNLLVILVVARNRAMRTARNVYIVNLAISDLMLCLITMPLTLVEILYMTWQVIIKLSHFDENYMSFCAGSRVLDNDKSICLSHSSLSPSRESLADLAGTLLP